MNLKKAFSFHISHCMKKLLITLSLFLCFLSARPQKSADLGVRLGAALYWGDIENRTDIRQDITALYGIMGRWNFNKRIAVRGQLINGSLKATGTFDGVNLAEPTSHITLNDVNNIPYELYLKKPDNSYNFYRLVQSFESLLEFNFRPYQMGSTKKESFTPYLGIGVGVFYSRSPRRGTVILVPQVEYSFLPTKAMYRPVLDGNMNKTNDADALSPTIPMAFGLKYNLSKRVGTCIELCVRKTFTDNIDNLKDPERFQNLDPISGSPYKEFTPSVFTNNDWYASLQISVYWQLWADKGVCVFQDKSGIKKTF